jgi:hypothetical protein
MNYARLPDGSRIVDALLVSPGARVRRESDVKRLLSDLESLRNNDLVLHELRALDGGGMGRLDHDDVLRRIVSALQSGRLVWELPAEAVASVATGATVSSTASPSPEEPKAAAATSSRGGTTVRASLFTGGTTFRKAPPPKKPTVSPVLSLEYAVVLLRSPDATRVECAFTQDSAAPKFEKGLRLSLKGEGEVEAYADEQLTTKLDLAQAVPAKVYLKGVKAGLFELALAVEEDERFDRGAPAKAAMAVVELNLALHKQDVAAIGRLTVNPDTDPVSAYHDDLKALKLPEQVELTDAEKMDGRRWLHVQRGGSHARAKLVLRKLDAARWPAGCDDYRVTLEAKEPKVALYDVEWDGAPLALPYAVKASELKAAEKTLWVEGREASGGLGDVRLTLGLDREPGGLAKTPKREGDVALLTVVEIAELKVDYTTPPGEATAWDEANGRFYINLQPDGREVALRATLKPALPDITVRFMLAPDPNNGKAANWGVDLPRTWIWKDIDPAVKHLDRMKRDHLLGYPGATDASGVAKAVVYLSRFGGDVFHPAGYLDQDPHLTRYVRGVPELEKRAPVFAPQSITVWRKFWVQRVEVEGFSYPDFGPAAGKWERVFASMENAGNIFMPQSAVRALGVPAIYPRYMVEVRGGPAPVLVGSMSTKRSFFSGASPEANMPVKVPILVCDFQWDDADVAMIPLDRWDLPVAGFPGIIRTSGNVLFPPVQGGVLVCSGEWTAKFQDPATGKLTVLGRGSLVDADIEIDPLRAELTHVMLKLPSGASHLSSVTHFDIENLVLKTADEHLGLYDQISKDIVACFNPKEPADFQNTVAHEVGHAFKQVCEPGRAPKGIPNHPHPDAWKAEWWHCVYQRNRCLMYRSGPVPSSLGQFCPICHPYVLVEDMSHLL